MRSLLVILLHILSIVCFAQKTFEATLAEAQSAQKSENYEIAISKYQEADALHRNEPLCFEGMIKSYVFWSWNIQINGSDGKAQMNKAKKLVSDFKKLYPNNYLVYQCEGYTHHYSAEYAEASTSYQKAIDLNGQDAESMFLLWTLSPENATAKINSPIIKKALEIDPNMAEAWQKLGDFCKEINRFDEAINHYRKALDIQPNYILYYSIASIQANNNLIDSAKVNYVKTLELKEDFAWGQYGMAYVTTMEEDFETAAQFFNRAIDLNPAVYPYYQQVLAYYPGLAQYPVKDPSNRAIRNSQEESQGYPKYYMEGIEKAQAFHYEEAIKLLKKSKDYEAKNLNGLNMIISINAWMSHCYLELGRYEKAINISEELLRLQKEQTLEQDVASLIATIAAVNGYWGRYEESIKYHLLSIEKLDEINNKELKGIALLNLAETYRMAMNFEQAVVFGKKASEYNKKMNDHENEIRSMNITARAMHEQGHTEAAIELLKKAVDICNATKSEKVMVDLQISLCDFYQSISRLEVANKLFNAFYATLSVAYYPNNPKNLRYYKIGASLALKNGDVKMASEFYHLMNENYRSQVKSFFPTMSEQGKILFYRSIKADFERFNSFAAQYSKEYPELLEEMYNNQLMYKSLLLNSTKKMKSRILQSEDPELIELYDTYLAKKEFISKVFAMNDDEVKSRGLDIKKLELQKDSIEVELGKRTALFQFEESKEPTWKNVQRVLKTGEVAIEMVRFRKYDFLNSRFSDGKISYAALILHDNAKPDIVVLENGAELEHDMYFMYNNSIKLSLKESNSYDVYWSKIAEKLQNAERLYVAPDGVYHKLNLNTFYDAKAKKYLIDAVHITRLTSTRDLLEVKKMKRNDRKHASLFGFPNYELNGFGVRQQLDGVPLNPDYIMDSKNVYAGLRGRSMGKVSELPGTLSEINSISDILGKSGWKCDVFAKNNALEENIKKVKNPSLLHIATHGFFDVESDSTHPLMASGLLLAGASKILNEQNHDDIEDGILTSYEAMSLDLDETDVVVLSACETGEGIVENGEGVYGLQRAFMVAGAKGVVMSLWQVDDEATDKLMVAFYNAYVEVGDYKLAFRKAELALMKEYAEPYFWGAFVYVGW